MAREDRNNQQGQQGWDYSQDMGGSQTEDARRKRRGEEGRGGRAETKQ